MRILIAHNRYQQEGGEDAVVANEARLLEERGHDVSLHDVTNDSISGWRSQFATAARLAYSNEARRYFAERVAAVRPEIVHVHNFFPLLTPSIYDACAQSGVAVVQTLHNYRIMCAGALLMRDGKPCHTCVTGSPYWGAWHGCYRQSRLASAAVAHMISRHRRQETWATKVDRFIALSNFARDQFIAAGIPADRISVKSNVVFDPGMGGDKARHGGLFVGRLSPEKGAGDLVRAWREIEAPLTIIGDGPLAPYLKTAAGPNVRFLGKVGRERVNVEMRKAAFLVLPSLCYENFPMAVAEAFSCSLPALVSRMGAMQEIVADGMTGCHFSPGDPADLAAKAGWALAHPEALSLMGRNARAHYLRDIAPDANYLALMGIYGRALDGNSCADTRPQGAAPFDTVETAA